LRSSSPPFDGLYDGLNYQTNKLTRDAAEVKAGLALLPILPLSCEQLYWPNICLEDGFARRLNL
jgi:hypothetical protein